jgi:rhomboid protease GluP
MAVGLSPKFSFTLGLDELSKEHFLVIALEVATQLGWNIGYKSENGFVAHTKFSMSSYSEEVKLTIDNGLVTIKSECTGSQLVDWGKNKKNVENFIDGFNELKSVTAIDTLDSKYEEIKPELVPQEEDELAKPAPNTMENLSGFLSIFKPVKGFFVTPLLIDLNILLFILMVASGVNIFQPDNESLINWGANFRPVTLEGEWWRLFTSCFLHIGIMHLLLNMYALLYIGLLLEPRLGTTRLLGAYILTGIAASITSLWWHDLTISAGASGAIFGMYGVFLAMLTTNLIEKSARKALLTSIGVFVFYNLVNGMKGGIDNAAHIGGLVSGLLTGYAFYPSLKRPEAINLKFSLIALFAVFVFTTSFFVYKKLPNDIGKYEKRMKSFSTMENMALKIYRMPENSSTNDYLTEIKNSGLYFWKENISLLNEVEQYKLPEAIHERNKKLLKYCELRVKSYELLYKAIEEDSDQYKDEIENYNREIEATLTSLNSQ